MCVFLTILTKIFDLKTIMFFSGKRYIFKSYYWYSLPFFFVLWNYIIWILDTIHLAVLLQISFYIFFYSFALCARITLLCLKLLFLYASSVFASFISGQILFVRFVLILVGSEVHSMELIINFAQSLQETAIMSQRFLHMLSLEKPPQKTSSHKAGIHVLYVSCGGK